MASSGKSETKTRKLERPASKMLEQALEISPSLFFFFFFFLPQAPLLKQCQAPDEIRKKLFFLQCKSRELFDLTGIRRPLCVTGTSRGVGNYLLPQQHNNLESQQHLVFKQTSQLSREENPSLQARAKEEDVVEALIFLFPAWYISHHAFCVCT